MEQIATALFANSPFTEGKPNGYLSMRRFLNFLADLLDFIFLNLLSIGVVFDSLYFNSQIWTDTDNNRAGMLPFVFDDSFG